MKQKIRSGEWCLKASKDMANKEVAIKKARKMWAMYCISKQFAYPNNLILSEFCEMTQNEHYRTGNQLWSCTQ